MRSQLPLPRHGKTSVTVCSKEIKFTHVFMSLRGDRTGPLYKAEGKARILIGVYCGVQSQIGLGWPRVAMMKLMSLILPKQIVSQEGRNSVWICLVSNPSNFYPSTGHMIGHYTQYVWAKTFQVGCGVLISRVATHLPSYSFHYLSATTSPLAMSRYCQVQCRDGLCSRAGV